MKSKIKLESQMIDDKDRQILMALQQNGRVQLKEISKKVNLSIDSVHRRMKEMMRKGIYNPTILIDPRSIGFPLIADIKVKLKNVSMSEREKFIEYMIRHNRCTELLSVMGDFDFTCVLIAKDSNELEELSTQIREKFKDLILDWRGILVLKTYKFESYNLL